MDFVTNILKKYIQATNILDHVGHEPQIPEDNVLAPLLTSTPSLNNGCEGLEVQDSKKPRKSILRQFDPLYESLVQNDSVNGNRTEETKKSTNHTDILEEISEVDQTTFNLNETNSETSKSDADLSKESVEDFSRQPEPVINQTDPVIEENRIIQEETKKSTNDPDILEEISKDDQTTFNLNETHSETIKIHADNCEIDENCGQSESIYLDETVCELEDTPESHLSQSDADLSKESVEDFSRQPEPVVNQTDPVIEENPKIQVASYAASEVPATAENNSTANLEEVDKNRVSVDEVVVSNTSEEINLELEAESSNVPDPILDHLELSNHSLPEQSDCVPPVAAVQKRLIDVAHVKKMTQENHDLRKENSELKLQLNAVQQGKAALELEIRRKEEIIIKAQAELINIEEAHNIEVKNLKEKLKESSEITNNDSSKKLDEQLMEVKQNEAKVLKELNQKIQQELKYQEILEGFENLLTKQKVQHVSVLEEYEVTKKHLANLELAFSDLHQKYEKAKEILKGMKCNEESLEECLAIANQTNLTQEQRYESLKAHACSQLEKANSELFSLKQQHDSEINKLKAVIKRLDIKCQSLQTALVQKEEECSQLSSLCEEITGKRV